jgi:hypothetical protein
MSLPASLRIRVFWAFNWSSGSPNVMQGDWMFTKENPGYRIASSIRLDKPSMSAGTPWATNPAPYASTYNRGFTGSSMLP